MTEAGSGADLRNFGERPSISLLVDLLDVGQVSDHFGNLEVLDEQITNILEGHTFETPNRIVDQTVRGPRRR